MILLTLSRGNEHERVHLRLPASPAEIGEAFVILDGIREKGGGQRMAGAGHLLRQGANQV